MLEYKHLIKPTKRKNNMTKTFENFTPPPYPKDLTLLGNKVILEPLNAAQHGQALFEANSIAKTNEAWDYLPYGPFKSFEDYTAWLEGMQGLKDPYFFAIIRKSDNKAIGVASYLRINPDAGSLEVGHLNFSPLLQKTTEATEAMFLMMQWAFENGYRRYEWKCNARHIKSRKAAQRLGFSYEGVFRNHLIVKQRNRNTAWFAMIEEEWPAFKACLLAYLADQNFDENGIPKTSLSSATKALLFKEDNFDFINL